MVAKETELSTGFSKLVFPKRKKFFENYQEEIFQKFSAKFITMTR